MIDTKLDRKVIAKASTKSLGGSWSEWADPSGEAHRAGVTEHPNIATIHALASDKEKELYIIMEFLPNGTLARWLEKDHRIEEIDGVVKGIADALEHIHTERKLVYADMKPLNVAFDEDWNPKILDFELSAKMGDDGMAGGWGGTLAYKAPEQGLDRQVLSVRTDIYSLAATIFSILVEKAHELDNKTTRDDFEKNPQSLIPFRRAYEKQLYKEQKKQVSAALHKALSREPNDRYASIKEFYQQWHQAVTAS